MIPCILIQITILLGVALAKAPFLGKFLLNLIAPAGSGVPDSLCRLGVNGVYAVASTKLDEETATVDRGYAFLSFQGDAGNSVTAQCVAEAALALVFDRYRLPDRTEDGFGTPAELLGMVLLERFQSCKTRPVQVQTYARCRVDKYEMQVYAE